VTDDLTKSGVSVIICTFNGARRLVKTIEHLNLQKVDGRIPWEVILVDNASIDGSGDAAKRLWQRNDVDLRVVKEHRQGLIYARHRGASEAQFDYLSFIDDDNWVDERWVRTVYDIFRHRPEVGICGGQIEPVCEYPPPPWFIQFQDSFAAGTQAGRTGFIPDSRGYLWGAGLNLRKSLLAFAVDKGFQSYLTGRKGKSILAGEDTEICYVFRLAGFRLWYDERLRMKHFMPANRLSWEHLCKMFRGFGAAHSVLALYRDRLSDDPGNREFPGYHIMIKRLVASLWRNRRFCGPASRFRNVPEKIYFEHTAGQLWYLISTGPWGFAKRSRTIFELGRKLSTNNEGRRKYA
jgi:glycosyltransferase involved in cell wall biosynthesis